MEKIILKLMGEKLFQINERLDYDLHRSIEATEHKLAELKREREHLIKKRDLLGGMRRID